MTWISNAIYRDCIFGYFVFHNIRRVMSCNGLVIILKTASEIVGVAKTVTIIRVSE